MFVGVLLAVLPACQRDRAPDDVPADGGEADGGAAGDAGGDNADGGDDGAPDGGFICVPGVLDAGVANWARRCPTSGPSPRYAPTMTYDPTRGVTVLFGGGNGEIQPLGDTFEWDGSTWTELSPATSPPGRSHSAMVYDSARGVSVMCGGLEWNAYVLDDTWEWDGTNWQQQMPPTNPPGRFYNAMAYDSARQVSVMFGGEQWYTGQILGDTWEWDGTNWTQAALTGVSPSARILHTMAYDPVRKVSVLFGGVSWEGGSSYLYQSDTWEWDGTSWTQLFPATSPPGRDLVAMVYDSTRGVMVLFAGFSQAPGQFVFDDTWEWDGTDWTQVSPPTSPSARDSHGMAFDSRRGVAVLFGGCPHKVCDLSAPDFLSDTWEWQSGQ
jgi:hypothetical protein